MEGCFGVMQGMGPGTTQPCSQLNLLLQVLGWGRQLAGWGWPGLTWGYSWEGQEQIPYGYPLWDACTLKATP